MPKFARTADWQEKLHDFVDSRKASPFAWGSNDCCLFVADAMLAMTGVDLGEGLRGKYDSLEGAIALTRKLTGGNTAEDIVSHFAEQQEMKEWPGPLFAQRGDLVLFDGAEGVALGIVYLNGIDALFVGPDGMNKLPVSKCRRSWNIAHG